VAGVEGRREVGDCVAAQPRRENHAAEFSQFAWAEEMTIGSKNKYNGSRETLRNGPNPRRKTRVVDGALAVLTKPNENAETLKR